MDIVRAMNLTTSGNTQSLEVEKAEPRDTLETEEPDDLSFDPSDVRESSAHSSRHESHNFRKYSVPVVVRQGRELWR